MSITRLKIAKLAGATDAEHIEKALESVPRVKSVTIDADANEAVVDHDGADDGELTTAVKQQGYIATIESPSPEGGMAPG
jgi:copper chaperone CopZ